MIIALLQYLTLQTNSFATKLTVNPRELRAFRSDGRVVANISDLLIFRKKRNELYPRLGITLD